MPKNTFHNKKKIGDYVVSCDICKMKCWASEAVILPKEAGKSAGLLVCPVDRDATDWGIMPFQILPEDNVYVTRTYNYEDNPSAIPQAIPVIDLNVYDPLSGDPVVSMGNTNWEDTDVNWEDADFNWED